MSPSSPRHASVSIITAVRNGARVVGDCLLSVKTQNRVVEHIVVDGASTDGTLEAIERHASPYLRVLSEPDRGLYDAMNKGILLARGAIVGILNSDDLYAHSHVVENAARVLDDSAIDGCYGDLVYVDADDTSRVRRYWRSGVYQPSKLYWGWMPPHPTVFVRRVLYERYGLFKQEMGSAADYELMLRFLLRHRVSLKYIPEVLVKMRTGGVSNASLANRLQANGMDRLAWKVNGLVPYPWTLSIKPVRKALQFLIRPPAIDRARADLS